MGRRILRMSRDIFTEMLVEGPKNYVVKHGLPADARIVKMSMDAYFVFDDIGVLLESAEWSEVPAHECVPEINIVLQTTKAWLRERAEGKVEPTPNLELDASIKEALKVVAERDAGVKPVKFREWT